MLSFIFSFFIVWFIVEFVCFNCFVVWLKLLFLMIEIKMVSFFDVVFIFVFVVK